MDYIESLAMTLSKNITDNELEERKNDINKMTSKDYFELNPTKKLTLHVYMFLLETRGILNATDELKRLDSYGKEVRYTYFFEGNVHYFENKEEVQLFFGENIHKVWSLFRRNKIPGRLEKVNWTVFYDNEGSLVGTKKRKVH